MWTAIGDTLPLAAGLALSPFAIVTTIVLLLGRGGRLTTAAFGVGWAVAIFVIGAIAAWLVEAAEDADAEAASVGVDVVQLGIAVLFLVLAFLTWRKRPRDDEQAENKLLQRLDGIGVLGALGIGLAQGFLVIKNIPLAVGAGAQIGEGGLNRAETVTALLVFTVVASLGVLIPLGASLVGGARLDAPLGRARQWLEQNMSAVAATVLLVLGAYFLGQSLSIFD